MSKISAKSVMALRERTGVGIIECKKALVEAGGDEEGAIEFLRKSGIAKAAKKAGRETGEGAVAVCGRAILKMNCETDFVAKNSDFLEFLNEMAKTADAEGADRVRNIFEERKTQLVQKLGENLNLADMQVLGGSGTAGGFLHFNNKIGALVVLEGGDENLAKEIAMHVVAKDPQVLSPQDVAESLVAKERGIWQGELERSGKPANILQNILQGKEKKFREESALLTQPFVKDDKVTIEQLAQKAGAKVTGFVRMAI